MQEFKIEDLNGTWFTEDGSKVKVENGIAIVLDSEHEYLKGFEFPINTKGKCSVTPNMDLKERDRTCDGYTA